MKAVSILVLGLAALATAQVASYARFTPRGAEPSATFSLGALDNEQLLRNENGKHGGFEFAHVVDVDLNLEDGIWTTRADGSKVWKLTIRSRTAKSLSVTFDRYVLPKGAELFIYSADDVRGAFTSDNNKPHGRLGTAPIRANQITIEYIAPASVKNLPEIAISKVAHGYKDIAYGSSGRCNINTVCELGDSFRDEIRSSAMMLTQFGSRYCSGAMINNNRHDGRQLFLTAYHCTGGDMSSDVLMFNYESPSCDFESQSDGPTNYTASGLTTLAAFADSDFTLFEVEDEIPDSYNVFLSGFNAENVAPVTMYGIHHPSGDIKKISFTAETGEAAWWSEAPNRFHWEVPHWDQGTTEPGSSGSPLYNADQQIIGQLHGGAAACSAPNQYDSYGALWASWDQGEETLAAFLDPDNTGNRVQRGLNLADVRARIN